MRTWAGRPRARQPSASALPSGVGRGERAVSNKTRTIGSLRMIRPSVAGRGENPLPVPARAISLTKSRGVPLVEGTGHFRHHTCPWRAGHPQRQFDQAVGEEGHDTADGDTDATIAPATMKVAALNSRSCRGWPCGQNSSFRHRAKCARGWRCLSRRLRNRKRQQIAALPAAPTVVSHHQPRQIAGPHATGRASGLPRIRTTSKAAARRRLSRNDAAH